MRVRGCVFGGGGGGCGGWAGKRSCDTVFYFGETPVGYQGP